MKLRIFTLFLLFCFKLNAQINLALLTNLYKQENLLDAKRALKSISGFQFIDSTSTDSIIGKIRNAHLTCYVKHNKINLVLLFTDTNLYTSLYKQSKKSFKYAKIYDRVTKGGEFSTYMTSFSNHDGPKIGSIEVLLRKMFYAHTNKIARYEILIFPYYEH